MKEEILILRNNTSSSIAVYIHWPFCLSKCPYCDFNSHTFDKIDYATWQQSYLKEIDYFAPVLKNKDITSIFFGGGTPSLMPPYLVEAIINGLANYSNISDKTEITIEANPTSVESSKFADFKNAGINRVSLGIQSFNPQDLKFLGRKHDEKEAIAAIKLAAKYFDNYSFDLIYARPNQNLQNWQSELELAVSLASKHISLYQLTIEKGTPFYSMYQKKQFALPDQDMSIDLYNLTNEFLADKGYKRYEISNYAVPGFESKHNLNYWKYGDYLGIGPGAHSRVSFYDEQEGADKMQAMEIIYNPQNWLASIANKLNGIKDLAVLSKLDTVKEILMMGLRLKEGINNERLQKFTGLNFQDIICKSFLDQLIKADLLDSNLDHPSLSNKGLALHNRIMGQMFENLI
jgi:putative oxygen-independent coproporphyrinogen III oxidase